MPSLTKLLAAIAVCALVAAATPARADVVVENLSLARIRFSPDGFVYFGTTTQPAGTCSNYGEYFRFDSTTPLGKQWVAVIIAAKLSGAPITVWSYSSSAPGTDANTGCTVTAVATVYMIGLSR